MLKYLKSVCDVHVAEPGGETFHRAGGRDGGGGGRLGGAVKEHITGNRPLKESAAKCCKIIYSRAIRDMVSVGQSGGWLLATLSTFL